MAILKTKDLFSTRTLVDDIQVLRVEDVAFRVVSGKGFNRDRLFTVGSEILDDAYAKLQCPGSLEEPIQRLWRQMHYLESSSADDIWQEFVVTHVNSHPIKQMFLEDPCTRWCVEKPRGYPGDAGLLDYYYGFSEFSTGISEFGRQALKVNVNVPAAWAVRFRLHRLAEMIDETLTTRHQPRILSVASGYLREAYHSRHLMTSTADFFAIDHDLQSLDVVDSDWSGRVRPINKSVFGLLRGKELDLGEFDLIYASGLYDYLNHETAVHLTSYLLQYLKVGGRLFFTNFLDTAICSGYLEAFMDWTLIYRSRAEMVAIFDAINVSGQFEYQMVVEPNNHIAFMEITRRE